MTMHAHIIAALREQLERWETLLASLSTEQRQAPLLPSPWTVKDTLVHLWAWQQRSIARLEAAQHGREPEFPQWFAGGNLNGEGSPDQINAWIYETYRDLPWEQVYTNWRDGYRRFLELGGGISERDLLDSSFYPWMEGYPLANVLLASYDHHQEHLEKQQAWLQENGK
jgi:hypothetical protein